MGKIIDRVRRRELKAQTQDKADRWFADVKQRLARDGVKLSESMQSPTNILNLYRQRERR